MNKSNDEEMSYEEQTVYMNERLTSAKKLLELLIPAAAKAERLPRDVALELIMAGCLTVGGPDYVERESITETMHDTVNWMLKTVLPALVKEHSRDSGGHWAVMDCDGELTPCSTDRKDDNTLH